MTLVAERTYTEEEYLELEEKGEERHEYVDGTLRLMAGTTEEHNIDPTRRKVEIYKRLEDGWHYELLEQVSFHVTCLDVTMTLGEVYASLEQS